MWLILLTTVIGWSKKETQNALWVTMCREWTVRPEVPCQHPVHTYGCYVLSLTVISGFSGLQLGDDIFIIRIPRNKLEVCRFKDVSFYHWDGAWKYSASGCIMGIVGCSVFGVWPTVKTNGAFILPQKSQLRMISFLSGPHSSSISWNTCTSQVSLIYSSLLAPRADVQCIMLPFVHANTKASYPKIGQYCV